MYTYWHKSQNQLHHVYDQIQPINVRNKTETSALKGDSCMGDFNLGFTMISPVEDIHSQFVMCLKSMSNFPTL